MAFLMSSMARSRGSTPEMAKKQVCMMVLMRPPMPVSFATRTASITKKRSFLFRISAWTSAGSSPQTSSGACGVLRRKTAPGAAASSISYFSRKPDW